jgi:hypothetical protein
LRDSVYFVIDQKGKKEIMADRVTV